MKRVAVTAICILSLPFSGWAFEQQTQGPCSPATGHITGNVNITINCPGEDPKTVTRLNELLDMKDKELAGTRVTLEQKMAEANEWINPHNS